MQRFRSFESSHFTGAPIDALLIYFKALLKTQCLAEVEKFSIFLNGSFEWILLCITVT